MITIIEKQEKFNSMYYIIYVILHKYTTYIYNQSIYILNKYDHEFEI